MIMHELTQDILVAVEPFPILHNVTILIVLLPICWQTQCNVKTNNIGQRTN